MSNKAMETVKSVANFFILKGIQKGELVTPMQVIKLCYISHGWNLAFSDCELFDEDIQAWKYGPVIPALYHEIKSYGNSGINKPLTSFDFTDLPFNPIIPEVKDREILALLEKIREVYKDFSAVELSSITHQNNTPWDIVWNQLGGASSNSVRIPTELIKKHYVDKLRKSNSQNK